MNKLGVLLPGLCLALSVHAQLRLEDKLRITEARRIKEKFAQVIWPGLEKVPFTLLLLTDTAEFLIHHPHPGREFRSLGYDTILQTEVFYRKPIYQKNLLATFPAVNGINCIVAGTPEKTSLATTAWIITLLHEHFHIYEYTSPGYYAEVDSLALSGGDQTGMWMLNFPFPYSNAKVQDSYSKLIAALTTVLNTSSVEQFENELKKYRQARLDFRVMLPPPEYRYFSFQVWQEGIARYTEYKYLEAITASVYMPMPGVRSIPDFQDYSIYKEVLYREEMGRLKNATLASHMRSCFYSFGFAEGLLLDRISPGWHMEFLKKKFFLEDYARN